ncbi:hydroxyethylthiazole kinase [Algihabitans albus]|uniref:hydroxyethylthiazole kinase n=1 Tax=Algihabitans albus TaxID=2164067 RepID=UPI000E5CE97B|nr:hydroxyethylthiazole kinase [Algihabitans albus]
MTLAATLDQPSKTLHALREQRPLVQNITNFVAMDLAANTLLAVGASPAMVHAPQEAAEFAALAGALTVNLGTMEAHWVESAEAAAKAAAAAGRPWVLDPVAVGATGFRRGNAARLLACKPTVVRGNASEIMTLAGLSGAEGKGVDSTVGSESAVEASQRLAQSCGAVVVVTGALDHVSDGTRQATCANSHEMMTRITASGCALTALTGACLAVEPEPLAAALHALAIYGVAAERAAARSRGPGSLRVNLLDELYLLDGGDLDRAARLG